MPDRDIQALIAESRALCEQAERRRLALADALAELRSACQRAKADRERLAHRWPSTGEPRLSGLYWRRTSSG